MAEVVKIKKGNIFNVVPLGAYESIYKAQGWEIVGEELDKSAISQELEQKGIIDENQQNAYIKAKNEKAKMKFTDGLFKDE